MKSLLTVVIVTCLMSGCNSEQNAPVQQKTVTEPTPDTKPQIDPPALVPEPEPPTEPTPQPPVVEVPPMPLEPSTPVTPPATEPQPPTLPIFIGEGVATHTQQPYSGTITRGGDVYLRYNQDARYFNDFELPEWSVEYKYQPYLEVLLTDGTETLCARYSWKLKGFGYARPHCLWSDTRAAVPLKDMQAAYYGYQIVESRVWVNGVVGLGVKID
ncbi:membrane lipoprotein [Vibrio phage 1.017.O._10N.286.55.C11]|nr:membrane lipoprotein [Vibrio phage 1.017.O._10N.286.55.C11]AUR85481.1 membrane lipoprotein [Vibrio phage 1.075.O._10N.286.55.B10]AUR87027.1 membrane lipoprotein [Vibrio phage 1.093.O._10N.286.55.E10]AUR87100.1 membrane lipoprotein [Vibrio phage 1.094.O._10N.286.55.E12]